MSAHISFIIDLANLVEETIDAPKVSLLESSVLRHQKAQEADATKELMRELRYLNTSAFKDPISHLLGWRVGKVAGRVTGAAVQLANMLTGG